MKTQLKPLLSLALCCLPMLAVPLLLSFTGALGWRTGTAGVVVTALAVLACPISMGLMMWQMSRHSRTQAEASAMPGGPPEATTSTNLSKPERGSTTFPAAESQ